MNLRSIIEKNYLLRRTLVSEDIEICFQKLAQESSASSRTIRFPSGTEKLGWVIPQKWKVHEAKILQDGRVIYDGMKHPLGVISQSDSFAGKITLAELKKHLHYAPDRPQTIPFHFRLQYRPWQHDWGFSVPKDFYDSLVDGEYEMRLVTEFKPGHLFVQELTVEGETDETILFVAHADHPGLSNDDLSGCVVGLGILEQIKRKFPERKYTYRVLLVPEILGSYFYLDHIGATGRDMIKAAFFLETLGNDNRLAIQESYHKESLANRLAHCSAIGNNEIEFYLFRSLIGNDEIVFEAPGFDISMPSISRYPYPEYHTSDETMDIIHQRRLQEALDFFMKIVAILETDKRIMRTFDGLPALSNPKYDLYLDPPQVVLDGHKKSEVEASNNLAQVQHLIPMMLKSPVSFLEVSLALGVEYGEVCTYFEKMINCGLVQCVEEER